MLRLYYIADDIDATEEVSNALHAEGITDHNFHVVARDEAGLYTHHIHAATTYQQLDVVHTGERFALIGAFVGFVFGAGVMLAEPFGYRMDVLGGLAFVLLGGMFGAWQGGMVGLTRENYKLAPFHHDLEAGRYLIMVDVDREQELNVKDLMRARFADVRAAGEDSTFINPFDSPPRVYHQNTH